MRRDLFCRAQKLCAETDGEKFTCRGVIQKRKEDKTAAAPEQETFGGTAAPLYVYFGDGERLCGAQNAYLNAGGVRSRVLYAQKKYGFCGALYVQALLEKEGEHDG